MTLIINKSRGTQLQLNPQIVKDQLQLYYDVNNRNSYTTGTTLTNMAPAQFTNGVNGTLDNSSMVQRPDNLHPYIQIETDDGANLRRISLDSTISFDTDDDSRTMSVWFWTDYDATGQYSSSHALFGGKFKNYWAVKNSSGPSNYRTEAETNGGDDGNHDHFTGGQSLNYQGWNNWTVTWSGGVARNYINGTYHSNTYSMANNSTFSYNIIGSTSTGSTGEDRGGTWRFGGLLIYNKALTESELDQNHKVFQLKFNRG